MKAKALSWTFKFNDYGEQELIDLVKTVRTFGLRVIAGKQTKLTIMGRSGVGKSMLSGAVIKHIERELILAWRSGDYSGLPARDSRHNSMPSVVGVFWPSIMKIVKDGNWRHIDALVDYDVLLVDDFGAGHDPSGFGASEFCELIERRKNKPTLITTNLTPDEVQRIDMRIWDRLVRDDGVVFTVISTKPHSER